MATNNNIPTWKGIMSIALIVLSFFAFMNDDAPVWLKWVSGILLLAFVVLWAYEWFTQNKRV